MAKRVTLHKTGILLAKEVQKQFGARAATNLKKLIYQILDDLESAAIEKTLVAPYAKGNYAKSFRFSFGSIGANKDPSFFAGAGYGKSGLATVNFGKMLQNRYISFYNIASKETSDGSLFHYAGLVDKYGWKSWSYDSKGRPRYKVTKPWLIMDTVFANIERDPKYSNLLKGKFDTTVPEGWE